MLPGLRHRRETDHRLRTPAPAQGLGRRRRRRAHVEGKGKGPQHRGEPLLQILDRAGEEKIGIALLERPRQAAADEGAVEDERRAHEALDMACVGRRSKGFFCSTRCHPRRTKCGKGISETCRRYAPAGNDIGLLLPLSLAHERAPRCPADSDGAPASVAEGGRPGRRRSACSIPRPASPARPRPASPMPCAPRAGLRSASSSGPSASGSERPLPSISASPCSRRPPSPIRRCSSAPGPWRNMTAPRACWSTGSNTTTGWSLPGPWAA